jgi:LPS-assembly protein
VTCVEHIIAESSARASKARPCHVWRRLLRTGRAGAWLVALALSAALLSAAGPAAAQTQVPVGTGNRLQQTDPNQPMLLQADEMIYDNQKNRVTARGNVEIYYGTYTLLADKVTYDRASNTLIAEGNVSIKEPDGAVINADRITLTDDFRDGFIASLKIVTQDDARIVAARAIREKGETTIFENAAFTPCKPCVEHPDKPPTWQVKAVRVIHKKTEATIAYENATFEFFGVPVAWMPYFKHADPSVKRKSGFLIPKIGGSEDLGFTVETPYYFALAPNYDFTFSPVYTQEHGILWKGKWRHRTANGRYYVDLAGIKETSSYATQAGVDEFRGTIKTEGEFALNQYWQWGWDVTAETDDSFRRFYEIDNILTTDRVSEVFLTGQRGRNYFKTSFYNFGGLLTTDTETAESWVHPVIDYSYVFADPIVGGELSFDTNVLSYTGDDGEDSARFITQMKWRRTFIDHRGQLVTPFFTARGDYYYVSDVVDPVTGAVGTKDNIVRGFGAAGIEYRYPFITQTANAAHVVEPIAQVIARPDVGNQIDVPNEDARSLVYDDTLLFDIDKFSGYDRIEDGTRANVGLRYTLQAYNGGYMRAVVGQSYQLGGNNAFNPNSGLDTTSSDYVTGLYVQPLDYFSLIAQGRFDEDNLDLKRTDLAGSANYGPFSTSVIYANLKAQPGLGIYEDRQEIQNGGDIALAENWSLFGHVRYDIEREKRITDTIGLKYHDDCFALSLIYNETFVRDGDIEPNEQIMFRFELKHLGAFDVDAPGTL